MPRILFEKKGNAVWISHLDLMRLFQRAFKRGNLPLKHTQGFNPRPSVSIALPLSVGVESSCELLDFDFDGDKITNRIVRGRLNDLMVPGIKIIKVYDNGRKIRDLALLDTVVTLEYDAGVPAGGAETIRELFGREEVLVSKHSKKGEVTADIRPMIKNLSVVVKNEYELEIGCRVCAQNPTLNPMLLISAIETYAPAARPDFAVCRRVEVYDAEGKIFR